MATTALTRRTIDVLAHDAGMHPELVRRLVAFGLVDVRVPLDPDAAARLARAARLRRDLGLNYAGAVLASELLARIDELQARLRAADAQLLPEVRTWTPAV